MSDLNFENNNVSMDTENINSDTPSEKAPQNVSEQPIPLYSTISSTQQADPPKPTAAPVSTPAPAAVQTPAAPQKTNIPGAYYNTYGNTAYSSSYQTPPTQSASLYSPYGTASGYTNPQTQAYKYPTYTNVSDVTAKPPKKKKEKRRYGLGQMIAVALISALCCGIVSGAVVSKLTPATAPTVITEASDGSTKTINISASSDSLVSAVAEKASPSVVGIRVTSVQQNFFFGTTDSVGEGSGVVYSKDGYIITNYHVVSQVISFGKPNPFERNQNKSSLQVFLPNDSKNGIDASIIGYDETADLAVLKIDSNNLTPIELGDSNSLEIGEAAIAIGNPGGLDFMGSVSSGVISGLNRSLQTEGGIEMNLIQTDAAINPGNSGGALVNKEGKLIGINNSKMTGNGFEGMGFAIPVNYVKEISDRLIKNQGKPQSYLGVTINLNYSASDLNEMGYPAGAVVDSVTPGSPAGIAGIQAYDIITKVNGVEIQNYTELNNEKSKYSPGETISITVYREGKYYDLKVTLGEMQG